MIAQKLPFSNEMLIPANAHQFSIAFRGKTVQWTRTASATWHAVELPNKDTDDYSVSNNVVVVRSEGKANPTDVSAFLKIPENIDREKIQEIELARSSLGTPIQIHRESGKIVLSQQKGAFFEHPVTITWKTDP